MTIDATNIVLRRRRAASRRARIRQNSSGRDLNVFGILNCGKKKSPIIHVDTLVFRLWTVSSAERTANLQLNTWDCKTGFARSRPGQTIGSQLSFQFKYLKLNRDVRRHREHGRTSSAFRSKSTIFCIKFDDCFPSQFYGHFSGQP